MGAFNRVTDTHWLNKKPIRIAWKKLIEDFVRLILDFIVCIIGKTWYLAYVSMPSTPRIHTYSLNLLQSPIPDTQQASFIPRSHRVPTLTPPSFHISKATPTLTMPDHPLILQN